MVECSWLTSIRFPLPTLTTRKPFRLLRLEQTRRPPRRRLPSVRVRDRANWIASAIDRRPCARCTDWRSGWAWVGWDGLNNGWPLWRDDHPLYYHSALVTRSFLRSSWTTAGYDPSFMAGYAKSVVFPSSSTLPELVVAGVRRSRPELAYKLYVLVSAAAVPWLIAPRLHALEGSRRGNGDRRLARSALRLDRLPDQLRGVRDAAVFRRDPGWAGGDWRVRAVPGTRWVDQLAAGDGRS